MEEEEDSLDNAAPIEIEGLHRGRLFVSSQRAIIASYVQMFLPDGIILVLDDINHSAKPKDFWDKVPATMLEAFSGNKLIFLACKDVSAAYQIFDTIDPKFATALLFSSGNCIEDNILKDWT
jgi:hypothetical protein